MKDGLSYRRSTKRYGGFDVHVAKGTYSYCIVQNPNGRKPFEESDFALAVVRVKERGPEVCPGQIRGN
jgi:hypothetical protein